MEYLVMECGQSYAVVLDEEGRFLKVPNLGYEVGQKIDHVIQFDAPIEHRNVYRKQFIRMAAMAACLCLVVFGGFGAWQVPVGKVRMQINPDIEMNVNHFNRVVGLEGINADGEELIEGYHSYGKDVKIVSDELADRAMEMGYLGDGGQITLAVESKHEKWRKATEEMLLLELEIHFNHHIKIKSVPAADFDSPDNPSETIIIDPNKISPGQTENGYSGDVDRDDDDWNAGDQNAADQDDDDQDDDDQDDDDQDDDDRDEWGGGNNQDDDDQDDDDQDDDDRDDWGGGNDQNNDEWDDDEWDDRDDDGDDDQDDDDGDD